MKKSRKRRFQITTLKGIKIIKKAKRSSSKCAESSVQYYRFSFQKYLHLQSKKPPKLMGG